MRLVDRIRRLFRPPQVVSVTRRPIGWFAVGRRRLHDVVAWAQLEDGQVVGIVADRRGLRLVTGRRFRGYLPAVPRSASDVQLSPPAVAFPVADLDEAIGPSADAVTPEAQAAVYSRLKLAAEDEWASAALRAFVADPDRFLRRRLELLVEHAHPADLDETERDWLAGLTAAPNPEATSARPRPSRGEPR